LKLMTPVLETLLMLFPAGGDGRTRKHRKGHVRSEDGMSISGRPRISHGTRRRRKLAAAREGSAVPAASRSLAFTRH